MSSKLLNIAVILTIIKVFIILFLLCQWEKGASMNFSKQISKLSLQLSFWIYFLLGQTEGEKKALLGRVREEGPHSELSPRALGCHNRWKSLSFCEIWNNPTPPLFLLDPLINKQYRTWISMINLRIYSRTF